MTPGDGVRVSLYLSRCNEWITPSRGVISEEAPTEVDKSEPKPVPEANDLVCPRCGGQLVLRTAKKGENAGNQFYGCSNFPKCRFVKNI